MTVKDTQKGVFIDSLRPASTAERCGALHPGDKLLGVDDVPIYDATTAAKLLRGGVDNERCARIQILPKSMTMGRMAIRSSRLRTRSLTRKNQNSLQTQERLNVMLRPDHRGLGIVLKPGDDHPDYVVDILEPGGPAERSGVLLPGDKVVALNRKNVRDMQPTEIAMILESSKVSSLNL